MRFQLFAVVVCSVALMDCARQTGQTGNQPPRRVSSMPSGWSTYEDDWIRVSYPAGSAVFGADNGKQDRAAPTFAVNPPPEGANSAVGAVGIQLERRWTGMLLRDALKSLIDDHRRQRATVLFGPREFPVKNAHCLGVLTNVPEQYCPKNEGQCFQPMYETLCDGPDGRRYYVLSMLSDVKEPSNLTPQARTQASTYEQILSFLEFKKPS